MKQNKGGIEVRLAIANDVSAIASVLHKAFLEFKSSYTHQAFVATTPKTSQIRNRLNEGPVWVALRNDAVIGTISVIPKGGSLYIRSMAVSPESQGQGIGQLLLKHVEDFASTHGYERLFLVQHPFYLAPFGFMKDWVSVELMKVQTVCLVLRFFPWQKISSNTSNCYRLIVALRSGSAAENEMLGVIKLDSVPRAGDNILISLRLE